MSDKKFWYDVMKLYVDCVFITASSDGVQESRLTLIHAWKLSPILNHWHIISVRKIIGQDIKTLAKIIKLEAKVLNTECQNYIQGDN